MIFISEYVEIGITEIVMIKSESYSGRHHYDKDKTYHDIAGKRDGKYFAASFSWVEPHKPQPGLAKVPKGHSEHGTKEISAEEYAALLKKHGLWGAPPDSSKKPTPPDCPVCGLRMKRRTSGRTGDQFWGCSAFPRCRGTLR